MTVNTEKENPTSNTITDQAHIAPCTSKAESMIRRLRTMHEHTEFELEVMKEHARNMAKVAQNWSDFAKDLHYSWVLQDIEDAKAEKAKAEKDLADSMVMMETLLKLQAAIKKQKEDKENTPKKKAVRK